MASGSDCSNPNKTSLMDIEQFIAECFKDDENNIPKFIPTTESRQLMTRIIQENKVAEKDAKEAIEVNKHLTHLYTEKYDEIKSLLPELVMKNINSDVLKRVERIAAVACNMNLETPTPTNLLLGIMASNKAKMQHEEKELINAFKLSELSNKISDTIKKNEIFKRDISSFETVANYEQSLISHLEGQCKFISTKIDEYNRRIKKSKQHLKSVGCNPSLYHSNLVQKAEAVNSLKEELNTLTLKLKSYQDLPASEMITKFKIEEAQKELLDLQTEFEALLQATS